MKKEIKEITKKTVDESKKLIGKAHARVTNLSKESYAKVKHIRDVDKAINHRSTSFEIIGRYDFLHQNKKVDLFVVEKEQLVYFPVEGQLEKILNNAILRDQKTKKLIKIINVDREEVRNFRIYLPEEDFIIQCYRAAYRYLNENEDITSNLTQAELKFASEINLKSDAVKYANMVNELNAFEEVIRDIKTPVFSELREHKKKALSLYPLVKTMIVENQTSHPIIAEFNQVIFALDPKLLVQFSEIINK